MEIRDLIHPDRIALHIQAEKKEQVLERLFQLQESSGVIRDMTRYRTAVLEREALGSTGLNAGIAVPHAKDACVERPSLAILTLERGIDCGAVDGQPCDLFFMIAAPDNPELHVKILSTLMTSLMREEFRDSLRAAKDKEAFLAVLERCGAEPAKREEKPILAGKVVAVTACPTGIAHTYMAAEALEQKAKELGISLRVETQGSGGVQNPLTQEEIAACAGVIIAADKDVDLRRFQGKPLLHVPVSAGISQPETLLRKASCGDATIYYAPPKVRSIGGELQRLYPHLMNGVSHMLPFVVGGGIFLALSLLLDDPALGYRNFGSNTPMAAWFRQLGELAFQFMFPVLAGYIAVGIADRPGLMVGFVGGILADTGATFLSPGGGAVSAGFLGAIIAGFSAGYLMLGLKRIARILPHPLDGIKPVLLYPVAGLLLIGIFMCLVNPFLGALNMLVYQVLGSLGRESRIAFGALLAGMMAVDLGGPCNKAAYVFGTSTLTFLAAGEVSDVMAAVMLGGMTPPIIVALATTCFPALFTEEERKSGPVNYILGLCFITEGVIPFAAHAPLRVLPACVVGSAVSGALSMALGCAVPAPHGGVFVFPVAVHAEGMMLALLVGSAVGMILLVTLKKGVFQIAMRERGRHKLDISASMRYNHSVIEPTRDEKERNQNT